MYKEDFGIYIIKNTITKECYIGSTTCNFRKRRREHWNLLSKDKHFNRHLQSAWNKYEEENFVFEVLEILKNKKIVLEREQYWIDILNPEYNICPKAGSCQDKIVLEDTRIKLSNSLKGVPKSSSHKKKISNALCKEFSVLKDGVITKGTNLKQFCLENNLSQGSLYEVLFGNKRKQHKGYQRVK